MPVALVTGSSGLIGSEIVAHFAGHGWKVHGADNNQRADFFGPNGDTRWNQRRLCDSFSTFTHHEVDIRRRDDVLRLLAETRPDLIVHTAAQPSHDLAASRPFDDFDVNAVGTMNMLEATRQNAPEAVFVHMSTNKVYGDRPIRFRSWSTKPAGTTRIRPMPTASPRTSPSTSRSTACSAPARLPPT